MHSNNEIKAKHWEDDPITKAFRPYKCLNMNAPDYILQAIEEIQESLENFDTLFRMYCEKMKIKEESRRRHVDLKRKIEAEPKIKVVKDPVIENLVKIESIYDADLGGMRTKLQDRGNLQKG